MSTTITTATLVCLGEDGWLELAEFAQACDVEPELVRQLVEEGLLAPAGGQPDWRFGGEELTRVRRIRRLQRDFEASLPAVALMLDLLDEIDRLRARLHQAGLSAD